LRKRLLGLTLLFLWMSADPVFSGALSEIELTDGSLLRAEIVSMDFGKITLRSPTLGTIQADKSRVRNIRILADSLGATQRRTAADTSVGEQVKILQEQIASDQELMTRILDLQNDPDFQSILADPEVMQAVNSGDVQKLVSNPKFMRLLDKPSVRGITQGMK